MFSKDETVLILIDVQGKLADLMSQRERLFNCLGFLLKGLKILGVPILVTEQLPDKLGPTRPEISKCLSDEVVIAKKTFSCLGSSRFMEEFKHLNRKQVLVSGIETHICVYQTCMDLLDAGYETQVVADCVSSRVEANKRIGINRMVAAGAAVTSAEMVLFELMGKAEGSEFKQIISLLKASGI